jgi:DNA-binding transcriptional LysR family regulator
MNFDQVRAFRLTAELGSFNRAAKEMFLTQPAISLQIRRLEQELGVQLFERQGKRLKLSPAGAVFLRFAKRLDTLSTEVKRELVSVIVETRPIVIGTASTVATHLLPSILAEFRQRAPQTPVHVVVVPSNQVSTQLLRGELDLAIMGEPPRSEVVVSVPIARERMLLVAPPSHPLVRVDIASPQEIASYPFVTLPTFLYSRERIHTWANQHHVNVQVAVEMNSFDGLREAARRGIGLALVPELVVADEIRAGQLAVINAPTLNSLLTLYLVRLADSELRDTVQMFIDIAQVGNRSPCE